MPGSGFRLAAPPDVEALLDSLAHRIRGDVGERTSFIGVLRRGAPLAKRLSDRIERMGVARLPAGKLKLERYADDLTVLHDEPKLDEESLDLDVDGRHVVLVDDVLYSGESAFRAGCFLRSRGAKRIQIAVLCARGLPTMPVRADFVGLQLDVGPRFLIDCDVPPYESELAITILPRPSS